MTVYGVPKPVITTTLSKSLLEANVDKFTVTYSATNAKSCMFAGTKYPTSGTATLGPYPAGKHSLTFSCSGDGGSTSHTFNWEAIKAVTLGASVSPATVKADGSDTARVSWTSANADSRTLDDTNAAKSGSKNFGPYSYSEAGAKSTTVACKNRLGSKSSAVNWTVDALAPVVSATLSQNPVVADVDTVNLSWTSSNSDHCSYGGRQRGVNGTVSNLGPFSAGKHAFTVSCTGAGGTTSDTVTLTAEEPTPPPTVTVSLDPATITANTGRSTLAWSSTNATGCSRNNSTVATSGNASVGPYSQGSHTFTISCTGPGGSANGNATLTVDPPPTPDAPEVTASLDPTTIPANTGQSTLRWSSVRATSCELDGSPVSTSGNRRVGPYAKGSYRFTVTYTGAGGTGRDTARLTVAPLPTVTVSLAKSTITANKDKVEMTWSSTGATACQYGSDALPTGGTREVGPFAEGARDVTVSCTGAGGTASDSASLAAVKATGEPDHDMDGIPDSEDPDDDNDGIPDTWEIENGFDSRNAADADGDADNDGHKNRDEHDGGSDPRWTLSTPGNIPEIFPGFNANYTVEKGFIDGDSLTDLLIRNPVPGVVPAVADFVMIQKAGGGFVLKGPNEVQRRAAAPPLAPINSVIRLHDLNADGVMDLMLKGLDSQIENAADQIIFSGYDDIYEIPGSHVAVDKTFKKFFSDLAEWIRNPAYLEGDVSVGGSVPIVKVDENPNEEEFLQSGTGFFAGYSLWGTATVASYIWSKNQLNCIGFSSVFCLLMGNDGYWVERLPVEYRGLYLYPQYPNKVLVVIPDGETLQETKLDIYNTSRFDYEARLLALNYLRQFRDSRTLDPGSRVAKVISDTLESVLNVEVFGGSLENAERAVFATIDSYCATTGPECDIIKVIEYILYRIRQVLILCTSVDPDECEVVPHPLPVPGTTDPGDESDPVVEITKTGTDELLISTAPAMPVATFNAEVKGLSGSEYQIEYDWHAYLYNRETGKKSQIYKFDKTVEVEDENGNLVTKTVQMTKRFYVDKHHDFLERIPRVGTVSGLAGTDVFNNSWTIPWGNILQGGNLTVEVTATVSSGGNEIAKVSDQEVFPITGTNPSLEKMREIIG